MLKPSDSQELPMSTNFDRVRLEAMKLPEAERAELARDLVQSLDAPSDDSTGEGWEREISRRIASIDAGSAKLIDRAEFRRQIQNRLNSI
jgi:putative addiction module component (TIGR02574 family)